MEEDEDPGGDRQELIIDAGNPKRVDEFQRRRAGRLGHHRGGVARAPVLAAVGDVDRVLKPLLADGLERDVLGDAAGAHPSFAPSLGGAKPAGGGAARRADIEVVEVADDPDRHRASQ
jgi:hypothetical protein